MSQGNMGRPDAYFEGAIGPVQYPPAASFEHVCIVAGRGDEGRTCLDRPLPVFRIQSSRNGNHRKQHSCIASRDAAARSEHFGFLRQTAENIGVMALKEVEANGCA